MPLLKIPESGLSFESVSAKSSKSSSTTQDVIGLTLTDGLIEEMIQCVQNGKPIQLSLGPRPNLSFGNTTQQLSSYQDPFTHELYHHDPSTTGKIPLSLQPRGKPNILFQRMLNPNWKPEKKTAMSKSAINVTKSVTAGVDSAREALEKSLALEKARKEENTTKIINATIDPKRGPLKAGNKSKFLSTPKGRLTDTTRSMPSSPALSGIGSPLLAPTSVPASQLLTEQAKANRKPIVHLLAQGPMFESVLRKKVDDLSDNDFKQALNKVADKNSSTNQYELLKNYYKELDVWTFNYDTEEDRQTVIDNAVKQYDRMRIPQNDDEWERLKPIDQRGDGKSLSKVQARIAQGPIPRTPKINVSNADSDRDTPGHDSEEPGNKTLSRLKNDPKRSSSQPPTTAKAKRVSEKEAQSKRLLSTKKKAPVAASSTKKDVPAKTSAAKPLSSQFVTDSDDEEASKPAPPPKRPSPAPKRPREDDPSSDSSQPLSKRARPSNGKPSEHRPSDANHSQSSASTTKAKGTSPQKSSPLASSPPTNASDFASSASSSASDTSTPRHRSTIGSKISRSPIHKRNASSSSLSTTSSASSTMSNYTKINPSVMQLAANFRCYYPTYAALHKELSGLREGERLEKKQEKLEELLDMHDRLVKMKREIKEASLGLS